MSGVISPSRDTERGFTQRQALSAEQATARGADRGWVVGDEDGRATSFNTREVAGPASDIPPDTARQTTVN